MFNYRVYLTGPGGIDFPNPFAQGNVASKLLAQTAVTLFMTQLATARMTGAWLESQSDNPDYHHYVDPRTVVKVDSYIDPV